MSSYVWENSVNSTTEGVGIIPSSRALKSLNSIKKIQPRMMYDATFNGNLCTAIVSCYSPTNASEEITPFYNELSSLVRHVPKFNVLIIVGYMNAHIGKDGNDKFC